MKIVITGFKSIENIEIELGQINIFIGDNGSGKSNILEAIGMLSAAVSGRVDDESIIWRGVRPGLPCLYKNAFKDSPKNKDISFCAETSNSSYSVSLSNSTQNPQSTWQYKTERWSINGESIIKNDINPEAGFVILKSYERQETDPGVQLLNNLRRFSIYTPKTLMLRDLLSDPQRREPLGLSGGGLPQGLQSLKVKNNEWKRKELEKALKIMNSNDVVYHSFEERDIARIFTVMGVKIKKYKGKRFVNYVYKEKYLPDFIIDEDVLVEYFGWFRKEMDYNSKIHPYYIEKMRRRIEFFSKLKKNFK